MLLSEPQDCIIEIGKGSNVYMEKGILIGFIRKKYVGFNNSTNYDVALIVLDNGRLKVAEIEDVIIASKKDD